jgi:hypothetical protein
MRGFFCLKFNQYIFNINAASNRMDVGSQTRPELVEGAGVLE